MQRLVSSYLSIVSWNINGIRNKIDDPDFLEHLLPHDIIFLSETWLDKGNENISIDGYFSLNIAQSGKHKNAKHNSGGVSVFIKNEYNKATRGWRSPTHPYMAGVHNLFFFSFSNI